MADNDYDFEIEDEFDPTEDERPDQDQMGRYDPDEDPERYSPQDRYDDEWPALDRPWFADR